MSAKLKCMRFLALFMAASSLSSGVVYAEGERTFPTMGPSPSEASSLSPSGHYSLYDEDRDEAPYHLLFLKEEPNGTPYKILEFDRSVQVSWKPDSQYFYVNNNYASDVSDCILFSLHPVKGASITEILQKFLNSEKDIFSSDPLYITCTKWKPPNILEVNVSGFGGDGKYHSGLNQNYELNIATLVFEQSTK